MKKYTKDIFLLSVFLLTAVFLSNTFTMNLFASETTEKMEKEPEKELPPELQVSELKQLKEGDISFFLGQTGFEKEEDFKVKFYLKDHDKKASFKKVYEETLTWEESFSLQFPLELKSSGFYSWKIRLSQKGKKAVLEGKEPLYLKGSLVQGEPILPEAIFIDDVAHISWKADENESYWVGIYDKKSLKLVAEALTEEKEAKFNLPVSKKDFSVAVAKSVEGKKGDFRLIDFPDRELPNTLVRFEAKEVFNKAETNVDIIYTGECFVTIALSDKPYLETSKEQGRFQIKLPEGEVNLKVTVKSENGNIRTFTKPLFVDTVFPKITLENEINGAVTGDDNILIRGSCDEEAELLLNGEKLPVDEKKSFHTKFNLNEGENEIKLVAKDRAGNITNVRALVKREMKHQPDIRVVILISGTFGLIFLAYFITFIRWLRLRKKRKS